MKMFKKIADFECACVCVSHKKTHIPCAFKETFVFFVMERARITRQKLIFYALSKKPLFFGMESERIV